MAGLTDLLGLVSKVGGAGVGIAGAAGSGGDPAKVAGALGGAAGAAGGASNFAGGVSGVAGGASTAAPITQTTITAPTLSLAPPAPSPAGSPSGGVSSPAPNFTDSVSLSYNTQPSAPTAPATPAKTSFTQDLNAGGFKQDTTAAAPAKTSFAQDLNKAGFKQNAPSTPAKPAFEPSARNNGTTDVSGKLTIDGKSYKVDGDGAIFNAKGQDTGNKFDAKTGNISDAKGKVVGKLDVDTQKVMSPDGKKEMTMQNGTLEKDNWWAKTKSVTGSSTAKTIAMVAGIGAGLTAIISGLRKK